MWRKWGFQYPVTCVFRISGLSADAKALRRDDDSQAWKQLEERTAGQFFSGIECVRFDKPGNRAFVSVGFAGSSSIRLKLTGLGSAAFDSIARYYDDRKAAYTLSNDNWGRRTSSKPGARWQGMTNDDSDSYQASVHACRLYRIPVSIAINSRRIKGPDMWKRMQEELMPRDRSWEPVVHSSTHPCNAGAYKPLGYREEIIGCRDDILKRLKQIPYGQYLFEFIPPCGYQDDKLESVCAGEFLFLRAWDQRAHPQDTGYLPWNRRYRYYGIGGYQTISYDVVMEKRDPTGRYHAEDVALLNRAFDAVHSAGGIFYAMWHADRYRNSVIYDARPGIDGLRGSTLMQHWSHVAGRPDVWYVANGWLYSYRWVAENATVR